MPQWVDESVHIFLPFKASELCVISGGNPHLWPIFNLIGPVEAKLIVLVILFEACHRT